MDRLPLVPKNDDHDVLCLFRDVFQDVLRERQYPKNIAENYQKYQIDLEFQNVQQTGVNAIKVLQALDANRDDIAKVEREILASHAQAIINKHDYIPFLEEIKLKRLGLFKKLSNETYELIQKTDFSPSFIRQYLDFTFNPHLHTCKPCKESQIHIPPAQKPAKVVRHENPPEPPRVPPFQTEPNRIVFHNYELNKVYKEKVKLRNITKTSQIFHFRDFPKNSDFHVEMLSNSCKLAPGMFAEFVVIFHPQVYKNRHEEIKFRTMTGVVTLEVMSSRDSPKLTCYVFNPLVPWESVKKPGPGSRFFLEQRQNALNCTIDCGTCFFGSYVLISVVMKNEGSNGKFFITTEQEWVFSELDDSATRQVELTQGCFHVFPVFFEIEKGEFAQIFVVFVPEKVGVFTEKLYVICDNNGHQEIELLGDSISFSSSFLKVNMYLLEDSFEYERHVLQMILTPNENYSFLFTIINDSPVYLEYYWVLAADNVEKRYTKMDADWINIVTTQFLPSFSTTEVLVQLTPKTGNEKTYYICLSLCLKNIPIESVPSGTFLKYGPDDKFIFLPYQLPKKADYALPKLVDVHIFELKIICTVKNPAIEAPVLRDTNKGKEVVVLLEAGEEVPIRRTLKLSTTLLHFGDIPKGVAISKSFSIRNLTRDDVTWKIVEIVLQDDDILLCLPSRSLSSSSGTLRGYGKKKIVYTIKAEKCLRHLSIIILFSSPKCTCQKYIAEAMCIVTYQISEVEISIRAANNTSILSPNFNYVGFPVFDKVYVHNEGVVTGCFYFLKPTGLDANKVRLRFQPRSSVVHPGTTIEVIVEIVALESGIFEDIYVPCFIGNPDKLVTLTVVIAAATISVHFYLPSDDGYKRVLWPPNGRIPWNSVSNDGEDWVDHGECDHAHAHTSTSSFDEILVGIIAGDSVVAMYPTIRMKPISVKKCAKLSFHLENLTPITGRFLVNPTNYNPEEECLRHILVRAKRRPPEVFWEKACSDGYGIVIEAERPSGDIVPYEVVEINLWIYANTWGTYLEEVIVEINDLTPFCFNLLVDVVGLPLEFPFARNTTLPCPTLRFGHVPYSTKSITKTFSVTNISAIPFTISWYAFTDTPTDNTYSLNVLLDFDDHLPKITMPKTFYGYKTCSQYVSVTPSEVVVERQSTVWVSVDLNANWLPPRSEKTHLKFDLVGFIGLNKEDKFKENYFRRDCGLELPPAKLQMLVTLELPTMQIEVASDETTIDVFVSDILLKKQKFPEIYVVLRNLEKSTVQLKLEIDDPFTICAARAVPSGNIDTQDLSLARNECLQITVTCHFSQADLFKFADILYQDNTKEQDYISVVSRDLNIYQQGICREVRLHFPHIKVKPSVIKFEPCLLYKTKKEFISIYNMTGSLVTFEIFKTTKEEDIQVCPNFGEVPASTGVNKQFVDIAVYFTPTRCKLHVESLRILTNIPQYYIDVPISGTGTNNEKFNPD